MKQNYYVIGCGGVCSYFLPAFLKTLNYSKEFKGSTVTLVDGDTIEDRNYERQLFASGLTGMNKAEALMSVLGESHPNINLKTHSEYVTGSFPIKDGSVVIAFVDNHPARKDILSIVDRHEAKCFIGANGRISASSYYYDHKWEGTTLDPRVRYPEILTTERGSPVHAAGCNTEEHLEEIPQTSLANYFAGAHTLLLWNFWTTEYKELDPEQSYDFWPVEISNTDMRYATKMVGDLKE
jgi:hypothetical protein